MLFQDKTLLSNNRGSKSKIRKIIDQKIDVEIRKRLIMLKGSKAYTTYKELYNWVKEKYLPELNYSTFLKHIKNNHSESFRLAKRSSTKRKKGRKKRTHNNIELTPEQMRVDEIMKELNSKRHSY